MDDLDALRQQFLTLAMLCPIECGNIEHLMGVKRKFKAYILWGSQAEWTGNTLLMVGGSTLCEAENYKGALEKTAFLEYVARRLPQHRIEEGIACLLAHIAG